MCDYPIRPLSRWIHSGKDTFELKRSDHCLEHVKKLFRHRAIMKSLSNLIHARIGEEKTLITSGWNDTTRGKMRVTVSDEEVHERSTSLVSALQFSL